MANVVEDEIITFLVNEEEGQDFNYDTFNVSNSLAMDERVSYYDDWVADTGTPLTFAINVLPSQLINH